MSLATKKYYRNNKDRWLGYRFKSRYGLSLDAVWDMFVSQGYSCSVCGSTDPGSQWCVDHCHDSSKNRAILCNNCNTAEGMLCSNPYLARSLANYIESHAN